MSIFQSKTESDLAQMKDSEARKATAASRGRVILDSDSFAPSSPSSFSSGSGSEGAGSNVFSRNGLALEPPLRDLDPRQLPAPFHPRTTLIGLALREEAMEEEIQRLDRNSGQTEDNLLAECLAEFAALSAGDDGS